MSPVSMVFILHILYGTKWPLCADVTLSIHSFIYSMRDIFYETNCIKCYTYSLQLKADDVFALVSRRIKFCNLKKI